MAQRPVAPRCRLGSHGTARLDFTGKTVVPFTTHAMGGLGTTKRDYTASRAGATFAEGLAVKGEEVGEAEGYIAAWLQRVGFTVS
ncbi:hypothetical protein ABZV80_43325 [Streptomyces sp. NPDC005132]|uniref:hypothetical protein n=1 Tax=Streptomyces sp. NPDC005132 TaxID=3154294 RepID=UPI0033B0F891